MSGMYEGAIQDLIDALGRLPGIGPKSAQRIAFHILQSDSDRSKLSLAPGLIIPIVIASSSTDNTCAEALRSDQVNLRRFFTSSITSGHALRNAAISKLPGTCAFAAALGVDCFALTVGGTASTLELLGASVE